LAPAPSFTAEQCDTWRALTSLPIHMFPGRAHDVMAASDLLLIASGTATLEAAIIGTPMIVTYRVSPLSWLLANLLVKVRWASLVNLVAGREVVPELLQRAATAESLAAKAIAMVQNDELSRVGRDLAEDVWPRLGEPGAAGRAADAILQLADRPA
jgi:lipid-A-disaccharide synthase